MNTIAPVAISALAILSVASIAPVASAGGIDLNQKITITGAAASEGFGDAVAMSGDVIMVAAPSREGFPVPGGEVRVYQRDMGGPNAWGLVKSLFAVGGNNGWRYGSSIAMDNEYAVIGASLGDGAVASAGVAFVHERNFFLPDWWGSAETIIAPDGVGDDRFGTAVGIVGDFCIVSAPQHGSAGEAYHYQCTGDQLWTFVKKISPSLALEIGDNFGSEVDMENDIAVIAADLDDASALLEDSGSVYILERNVGGANFWGLRTKIEAPDAESGDRFGGSVSLSGDLLAVGAWHDDDLGAVAGAAYLFGRHVGGPDNWGFIRKITAPDGAANAFFGASCSLRNDFLLVGAHLSTNFGASQSGGAYLFGRDIGGPDNWGLFEKILPPTLNPADQFGTSVALGDNELVIGARGDDDEAIDAGAVYIFDDLFYAKLNALDCNNNGVADIIDIAMNGAPDCNDNLIPDSCDIFNDPGLDLDENGLIDACEIPHAACIPGDLIVDTADLGALISNFGFICP